MSKDSVITTLIYLIAELPPQPAVKLNDDEQTLFLIHQFRCKTLSLFLRWIRLGEPQSELLLLPEMQAYEPFARFINSLLTLAIQVHPRSDDGLIRSFGSPVLLWYACISLIIRDSFVQALTGYPQFRFKKEAINNARNCLKVLYELEPFRKLEPSKRRTTPILSADVAKHPGGELTSWLLLQAGKIAATDTDFQKDYYYPCLRALKKIISTANESENFQMNWIDLDRQLASTKQSKKRKLPVKN
ncbi:hypothetical protein [Chroococcidiopsis thermalis]|nr:hypothetical protein [Chroococcidiopsis thermalis]